jgi:non-specific serine/threonine protein kinase
MPESKASRLGKPARPKAPADHVTSSGTILAPAVQPRPNNLPADLTRFIGREQEIAEVKRLLASTRLLTLSGSGGVGKTRLALRVAAECLDQYRDGVWLVELAPVADPTLVPKTVAANLGLTEQSSTPLSRLLVERLGPKQLLLVLDNCEHLIQACSALVETLMRRCPGLRVLATSRQSINVPGETTWRVPSLALPPAASRPIAEILARYDATRLFGERAVATLPSFTVTDATAAAIIRICTHLDGIPLAIELAAARVSLLSPDQIDDRLGDRFRLLTSGSRTALPRQQTLRATLDWSFSLLSEPERVLLRRLAVFAGGWTLEAVEAVCADDVEPSPQNLVSHDVLDLLAGLVDKSLVIVDENGESRRYRLLETMREYGWEKLHLAGEERLLRNRHRDWFLALAEEGDVEVRGFGQARWLARLEREHDNFRAALGWCLGDGQADEYGLRFAGALAWFWRLCGHIGEGRRWLDLVLARSNAGDVAFRSRALNGAGFLAHAMTDPTTAIRFFTESLDLVRESGDQMAIGWAWHGLGRIAELEGDSDRTTVAMNESLAAFQSSGDVDGQAYALFFLGRVAQQQGDYDRASSLYAESLRKGQQIGDTWLAAWTLIFQGSLADTNGDVERAGQVYRESLALFQQIQATWGIADCLWRLAVLAARQGQLARAAQLFGAEQNLFVRMGISTPAYRASRDRELAATRSALGEARFDQLIAEGYALTQDEAVSLGRANADRTPSREVQIANAAPLSSAPLTRREQEVAILIARGYSNREIASALIITPRTADTHVRNIFTRLELHSRAQVATWVAENHLLTSANDP